MGESELFSQGLMDSIAEVQNRAFTTGNNHGCLVVRNLSLGLGVNTDEIQIVPNSFHQFVEVPLVLSADGHVMREFVKQIELFDGDGVNLVENIDARDIDAVAFDDVDEVIHGVVLLKVDVAVGDFVLVQNRSDRVVSHLVHCAAVSPRNVDSTAIFSLQSNSRLFCVESDAETCELSLNDPLVSHGLLAIKHDQNEGAGTGDTDDLLTTTFTILGSFNDTWQIEKLDFRATVVIYTWYTGQCCKLIVRSLRELAREFGE